MTLIVYADDGSSLYRRSEHLESVDPDCYDAYDPPEPKNHVTSALKVDAECRVTGRGTSGALRARCHLLVVITFDDGTAPTPLPPPSACGAPTPPSLHHFRGPAEKPCSCSQCCDSTPYVCDRAYCRTIGFTDGRGCCAVRTDGSADRVACEHLVIGGDAAWTSSTGQVELCNENHLRAKCPGGCAWIEVSNVSGTVRNRKTF